MPKIRVRKVSKNLKLFISIFTILIMSPLAVSLAKYVYSNILDIYFASQDFYFESDKLKRDGTLYSLDYWNGVDPYEIAINLNSYKNNTLKSSTDIDYLVNYNCPSNVTKTKGTIYKSSNNDIFYLTITPKETFKDGESVSVDLSAASTSPYKKSLSATFKLVVGKYGLSHEISDSSNNIYLEVKVTNTIESYTIKKAFSTYKVGDSISMDVYNSLTKEEKANCVSASITISFDPNVVYINNNSTTFLNGYDIKTTKIDNYVIKHFRIAFGNRIVAHMKKFVPVYVACGGEEVSGVDYFIARKILRKFEQLNVSYIRDEIDGFIEFLDKTFGKDQMKECIDYLKRLKKLA